MNIYESNENTLEKIPIVKSIKQILDSQLQTVDAIL